MNLSSPSALLALICLFFVTLVTPLAAQTAPKVKKIPFHGKLAAVDTSAQTITIAGKKANRVFHLSPTTKIIDGAGNPSSLAAATVGEDVGGSYAKDASGTMTLFSVRFGAKSGSAKAEESAAAPAMAAPAAAPTPSPTPAGASTAAAAPADDSATAAATPAKKKRFSGKVVSVDAAGGTLVVHGLTLTTTASTKITGATSLSDIAAGDKVSGSYLPSADGSTMTVITLKKAK